MGPGANCLLTFIAKWALHGHTVCKLKGGGHGSRYSSTSYFGREHQKSKSVGFREMAQRRKISPYKKEGLGGRKKSTSF